MPNFQDSYLSGSNIEFIEALYARYLEDPQSVDQSWRELFEKQQGGQPIFTGNGNGHALPARRAPPLMTPANLVSAQSTQLQAKVDHTIFSFRLRGHLLAQIDPLARPRPPLDHVADAGMVNSTGQFTESELEQLVDSNDVFEQRQVKVRDLLARLRRTYSSTVGVEYMNLLDSDRRRWLMKQMEWTENHSPLTVKEKTRILKKLSYAEGFESFLHTKYVGAKRFSLDGGESLIPMLDAFLELGGELGVKEVVIGMAHRGRLNVLTNLMGKSPDLIFSEFDGPTDPKQYLNRGDVKYHQGFSSDYLTESGKKIHLSMCFNPSHLEVVYPVVEGRTRAKQERVGDDTGKTCVPLVIHGDAALAGQGLIAETLNLSNLKGYSTGGTVHLVINNQVGFTTEPEQSRSSIYCTAVAQMLDIPIFHVNADDPEACVHVMKLATQYRQKFGSDVVIDLVCYRRYGHNEGDEPAFTQPNMYEQIRSHPTVRTLYALQLSQNGSLTEEQAEEIKKKCQQEFQEAHALAQKSSRFREPSFLEGLWKNYRGGPDGETPQMDTGVSVNRQKALLTEMVTLPEGFTPHPTIARFLKGRQAMIEGKQPLDWSAAEALALGSLLFDGYSVRLTGQDTERGTFSHRHAVLHDVKTGAVYNTLAGLAKDRARCTILNSPLSEMGCLGFEFGYSLDFPDALVGWEAQFGDFANNAQVMIDQFIAAAEDKWKRLSGLTLLLPHGYEGQGPEHSSARLERFLELCAEDNLQVCYPSTPAQIFHLLRRQVVRPLRKPLVVMTPKSLLRRPGVVSTMEELAEGTFRRVLPDKPEIDPKKVTRLLLCTGKVYYDLLEGREAKKDKTIGIVRIEQLYPLPRQELVELMSKMPKLEELFWVQEEPKNNGAWRYLIQPLQEILAALPTRPRYGYIGRVESASPATGFLDAHKYEQQLIVDEATTRGTSNGR